MLTDKHPTNKEIKEKILKKLEIMEEMLAEYSTVPTYVIDSQLQELKYFASYINIDDK